MRADCTTDVTANAENDDATTMRSWHHAMRILQHRRRSNKTRNCTQERINIMPLDPPVDPSSDVHLRCGSLPDLISRAPVRGRIIKKMCGPPQRARRAQRAKRGTQGGPPRGGAGGERQHTNKLTTASRTNMIATKNASAPQITEFWKNCHLWRAREKAKI